MIYICFADKIFMFMLWVDNRRAAVVRRKAYAYTSHGAMNTSAKQHLPPMSAPSLSQPDVTSIANDKWCAW